MTSVSFIESPLGEYEGRRVELQMQSMMATLWTAAFFQRRDFSILIHKSFSR